MAKRDPLIKAEGEENENENAETEEEKAARLEAAKKDKAAKAADLSEDDLVKSLERLTDFVAENDEPTRKQALLEKAQSEELSKAERDELFDLMGDRPAVESLADAATAGIAGNESIAKALDVSEFLQEQNTELCKALTTLAEAIEGVDTRQHEFNLMLAKAVTVEGKTIHAMGERLGVIENQPARAPKSKGVNAAPLRKSFGDQQGQGQDGDLSKSEIMGALYDMVEKSADAGKAGVVNGHDLVRETSKFEQFNRIDPGVMKLVQAHIASKGAAIH